MPQFIDFRPRIFRMGWGDAIGAVVGFVCFICLGLGGLGDGGVRG